MGETKTEKYILKLKEGGSNATQVIEEIKKDKVGELETKRVELEIAKLKAEIKDLESKGQPVQSQQAQGLVSAIIAQNFATPERAQAFLSGLDEESTNRLALLIAADSPQSQALTNLMRSPTSNVKEIIEIVKLVTATKGEGTSITDVAKVFQMGIDAARSNQPQPQSIEQGYKYIFETFVKPIQDSLNAKDKEVWEERLKNIETKIVNPLEWVKQQKTVAAELGLGSSGSKSTVDIQLEDMRQSHDLDMSRLTWEMQKFMMQQETEKDKWLAIQNMLAPITAMAAPEVRSALRGAGRELSKTLGGSSGAPSSAGATQPQTASFTCPECDTELSIPLDKIPAEAEEVPIKCPKCGTITPAKLKKVAAEKEASSPSEEKPAKRMRLGPTYR